MPERFDYIIFHFRLPGMKTELLAWKPDTKSNRLKIDTNQQNWQKTTCVISAKESLLNFMPTMPVGFDFILGNLRLPGMETERAS